MKKQFAALCHPRRRFVIPAKAGISLLAFALFAACGDEVTQINQTGLEVVASVDDLPKCNKDNEGEQAIVKGESVIRVCVDGDWVAVGSDGADSDFSCKTEELKDKSGLKIVCNGDSIGVVLNGSDGKQGEAGKDGDAGTGCEITDRNDTAVVVKCGEASMTIDLNIGLPNDTAEADSERTPISLDSLVGFTQKGPFLKGSTVYLYELSDGRTLKQTNGNFTSNISQDNGRYKFLARDLVSQYAMVVVDGYYRNEVTGVSSNAPIRLKAITDMRKRNSVNVNILTHSEFERVYHLVTRGDKDGKKLTVKQAKRKAQQEIMDIFDIKLDEQADAEDLNVFGTSDADAALLAFSILLQGDRSESELMALLSEISNDMAEDGKWDGNRADSIKASIVLWMLNNHGRMDLFRNNVKNWGLGDVPPFEKYIENFMEKMLGIPDCSDKENGYKETIRKASSLFDGKTFVCNDGVAGLERAENKFLNPNIKYGTLIDYRDKKVYRTVEIGQQTWMAENLNYIDTVVYPSLLEHSWCYYSDSCETYGRLYEWGTAMDSAAVFSNNGKGCGNGVSCSPVYPTRGLCPDGWHIPSIEDAKILQIFVSGANDLFAKGFEKLPDAEDVYGFSALPMGYTRNGTYYYRPEDEFYFWVTRDAYTNNAGVTGLYRGSVSSTNVYPKNEAHPVRCVKNAKAVEYGQLLDERDGQVYKTVKIGNKTWMAENLNYRYLEKTEEIDSSSFCHNGDPRNCEKYGRLYFWSAAMDSAAVFSDNGKGCGHGVTCSPTYPVRGVCPEGWHFPTREEWEDLLAAHGRISSAYMANQSPNIYGFSLLGTTGSVYLSSYDGNVYYDYGSYLSVFCPL